MKTIKTIDPPKSVVIALSGGMDSASLVGLALSHNTAVTAVSFVYGSKHNKYEREAAETFCQYFQINLLKIDLSPAFTQIESNLMKTGGEIPEGHYEDENMKLTVVPNRNMIMSSVLAGIAVSKGIEAIGLGVHSGDHAIYPDCRPEFIAALQATIRIATDQMEFQVWAPFIELNKTDILSIGYNIGVPYGLTRTCYKDQPFSCGKCGSCTERLEAFQNIGKRDPVLYANSAGGA